VGSYWPYLSTVWDYVHRSMPYGNAQSLTEDEVYGITAYILYSEGLVDYDFVLTNENFTEVRLPNEDGFYVDDRVETEFPGLHRRALHDRLQGRGDDHPQGVGPQRDAHERRGPAGRDDPERRHGLGGADGGGEAATGEATAAEAPRPPRPDPTRRSSRGRAGLPRLPDLPRGGRGREEQDRPASQRPLRPHRGHRSRASATPGSSSRPARKGLSGRPRRCTISS
jgi:hypothetical protein